MRGRSQPTTSPPRLVYESAALPAPDKLKCVRRQIAAVAPRSAASLRRGDRSQPAGLPSSGRPFARALVRGAAVRLRSTRVRRRCRRVRAPFLLLESRRPLDPSRARTFPLRALLARSAVVRPPRRTLQRRPRADRADRRRGRRRRGARGAARALVPLPVMLPSFWVASTKPEAALVRSKAGLPC